MADAAVGAATGLIIFWVLYIVFSIAGFVRLIVHWTRFGDRAIAMLLVLLFIPFGFLWPLLATPGVILNDGRVVSRQYAMFLQANRNKSSKSQQMYY